MTNLILPFYLFSVTFEVLSASNVWLKSVIQKVFLMRWYLFLILLPDYFKSGLSTASLEDIKLHSFLEARVFLWNSDLRVSFEEDMLQLSLSFFLRVLELTNFSLFNSAVLIWRLKLILHCRYQFPVDASKHLILFTLLCSVLCSWFAHSLITHS